MAIPATAEEISAKKECDRISSDILDYFSELANVQDPTDLSTKIEALSVNLRASLARWPDGVRVYFYVDDIVEKTRDTLRTFLQEKEAAVLRAEEADNSGEEATRQRVEREKDRLGTKERENGARYNSALVVPKNVLPEDGSANASSSGGISDAPITSTSSGKLFKSTRRRRVEGVSGEPEEQSGAKRRKTSPELTKFGQDDKCTRCQRLRIPCVQQDGRGRTCKSCFDGHVQCERMEIEAVASIRKELLQMHHKYEEVMSAIGRINHYTVFMASHSLHAWNASAAFSSRLDSLEGKNTKKCVGVSTDEVGDRPEAYAFDDTLLSLAVGPRVESSPPVASDL